MTVNGTAYQLALLVPLTSETGCGLLPTPRANNQPNATPGLVHRFDGNLESAVARMGDFGRLNPNFVEWLMGFPTNWTDSEASEILSSHKFPNLLDGQ